MRIQNAARTLGFVLMAAVAAACTSSAVKKQQHFDRANAYASKGQYPEAIIEYRSALQLDDKFGPARYRLALAYQQSGDLNGAYREMIRAADLMPDNDEAQLSAGQLLMMAGRYEDAAARARSMITRNPKNVDAFVLLGRASSGLKDSDPALATLEQAIKQLPGDPRLEQSIGELLRSRGSLGAAESSFKRAIDLAPTVVENRQALAGYYFSVGRTADAEKTLEDALELDTSNIPLNRDLAILYFLQGRDREAEPLLLKVIGKAPGDVASEFALGDLYTRTRRFDDAVKAYAPMLQNPTTFGSAAARTAFAEFKAGRKDTAYKRLAEGSKKAPQEADIPTMHARLLLEDGKLDEAAAVAKIALAVDPERFEALYVVGSVAVEQGNTAEAVTPLLEAAKIAPKAVGPRIQLGRLYLDRGETQTALQFANEAVALAPTQPLAQLLLVRAYTQSRDVPNAEKALNVMLKAYPTSPQTQAAAGHVALLKADIPAARRSFTKALELDPALAEATMGLVSVELASKRPAEAVALVDRSIAAHPDDARLLLVAAKTYLAAKDTKRAEDTLRKAIAVSSGTVSFEAYSMLAGIYFSEKRLDEARAQFEASARQQPTAIAPPTMIGIILQLQGKPKDAQSVYEQLVQKNPNASVAANNLAMLLVESGENLDLALNYAQMAKKAAPGDANVDDTLGLAYLKKGLGALAVAAFEQSVKADPKNPEFLLHLGQAYASNGDKSKAREALKRVLTLDPSYKGIPDARKALEDLDKPSRASTS